MAVVFVFAAAVFQILFGASDSSVFAATFNPPSAQPPEGNIPVTVWNRTDTTAKQAAAAIEIDGGGPAEAGKPVGISVGDIGLDLGKNLGGQNLYYGFAPYANMNAGDRLLLLQTSDAGVWTDRASLDRDGNLSVSGCFGPVFRGVTTLKFNGNLNDTAGGYFTANTLCVPQFGAGAHVCATAEILNSIKCAGAGSKIKDVAINGQEAWIQDGPPGYTAPANDCQGWQSKLANHLGRMWRFQSSNGGQGFLTTCNQDVVFACCR
ncbi:MAG: hypothetical protein WCT10_00560 [Patescibacteria group bacterium]|jgi:hypothetical protein